MDRSSALKLVPLVSTRLLSMGVADLVKAVEQANWTYSVIIDIFRELPGPHEDQASWYKETFLRLAMLLVLVYLDHEKARIRVVECGSWAVTFRVEYLLGDEQYPSCIAAAKFMTVGLYKRDGEKPTVWVEKRINMPAEEMILAAGDARKALVKIAEREQDAISPLWDSHGAELYRLVRAAAPQQSLSSGVL